MPRPRKFRIAIPKIRIVNRCVICGEIIPQGRILCNRCARKAKNTFGL